MNDNEASAWEAVVQKMTAQTTSNQIVWMTHRGQVADLGEGGRRLIAPAYLAEVRGRRVLVLEYEYDHWLDEDGPAIPTRDVAIKFLGESGESAWEFPETLSRWKLIQAIRYQISDAGGFLDSYLHAS